MKPILKNMADLLLLDADRLAAFVVDSTDIDLADEVDREIEEARRNKTWDEPRVQQVLRQAKERADAAQSAEDRGHARADLFLSGWPDLDLTLRAAVDPRTMHNRVRAATGGLARSLERSMSRRVPAAERRFVVERRGDKVVGGWSEPGDLDVLDLAQTASEDMAELTGEAAKSLAQTLVEAMLRGEDVLPGFAVEATGKRVVYRRLPPHASGEPAAPTVLGAAVPASRKAPVQPADEPEEAPREWFEPALVAVEIAVGEDLRAARSGSPMVCGEPRTLPAALDATQLASMLDSVAGGDPERARGYHQRLKHLFRQRLATVRSRPRRAALANNMRTFQSLPL